MDDSTTALIASSASASAQPQHAHGTAEDTSEAGRAKRSRRDRPCDNCRAKHQCDIPVRGEPCKTCKSRSKTCTFLDPPTARVRKPKADTPCIAIEQDPQHVSQGDAAPLLIEVPQRDPERAPSQTRTSSSSDSFAYARPSTTLSSVLSLVRNFVEQAPLPLAGPGQPPPTGPFLSPGGGRAELHYISAHAFSDLTFSVADEHVAAYSGDVGFRQVSADPALPAFFVQTPSLMYGTTAPSGRQLYEAACAALAPGAPQQLVEIFISQTQPAFPILDLHSFPSSDPAAAAQAGVSYGLLTSLLAHSTCYVHEIRPAHKHLWRQVLLSLEDEYRKPTLQTLQQALVVLASRPPLNLAQNHLAMGRLASAAQILGLHLDPTLWRIPRDERVLRKRLWWSVLITDKMRALWYGRPSNISRDSWNVSLPTLDDLDAAPDSLSAQSFIASCKLTVIIDSVLSDFFTVRSLASPRSPAARLGSIEQVGRELSALEQDLPAALRRLPGPDDRDSAPAPSGVRSFQLCKLGLEMSLLRLATTTLRRPSAQQLISTSRTALGLAQTLVEFLENLNTGDFGMFWAPYCSFIISAAAALLIRTALTASTLDPTTRTAAGVFFTRLVVCLTSSHHAAKWDVASLALDRIATLLRSLNGELPELVPLLQLFGPPNHASTGPPPPPPPPGPRAPQARTDPSPADPVSALTPPTLLLSPSAPPHSLAHFSTSSRRPAPPAASPAAAGSAAADQSSPALDAFWWMTTEILSLPDHLGAPLPDIFEGWPTFTDHDHAGAALGGPEQGGDGAGDFATGEGMLFDLRSFLEGPSAGAQPSRGGGAAGPAVGVAAAPDGT
ncbi:hypothetical protein JCM9279_006649 [Rhodotorula babjevae]